MRSPGSLAHRSRTHRCGRARRSHSPSPRRSLRSSQSSPACRPTCWHYGRARRPPRRRRLLSRHLSLQPLQVLRATASTPASIGSRMRANRNFGRAIVSRRAIGWRCRSRCRVPRTSMSSTKTTWGSRTAVSVARPDGCQSDHSRTAGETAGRGVSPAVLEGHERRRSRALSDLRHAGTVARLRSHVRVTGPPAAERAGARVAAVGRRRRRTARRRRTDFGTARLRHREARRAVHDAATADRGIGKWALGATNHTRESSIADPNFVRELSVPRFPGRLWPPAARYRRSV